MWFFIKPNHAKKYEELVEKHYLGTEPCLNVTSHKDVFPNLQVLANAGIEFYTFLQKTGDLIVTGPNVYHGIINMASTSILQST